MLTTRFIPCTLDTGWGMVPEEKQFFLDIKARPSTAAWHVCTAGGKGLSETIGARPSGSQLEAALGKFEPEDDPKIPALSAKSQSLLIKPPPGTLVLYMTWSVLGGHEKSKSEHLEMMRRSLGADRVWVRKDEAEALAKGVFPESLKQRMFTKSHLPFVVAVNKGAANQVELTFRQGRLAGVVQAATKDGNYGHDMDVLGFIEAKEGKITRFDVVAKGPWWSATNPSNYAAGLNYAGDGRKYPVAVTFTLADPNDLLAKASPAPIHVAAEVSAYLR